MSIGIPPYTPGPGAYKPKKNLKKELSHSFPKENGFQNSTNTTSNSKKIRDLIPPLTRSPEIIIDSKKIDQMILNDAKAAGISYFRNEKNPEHLKHTYQFQNKDKTKILEFIGISHLDNLKVRIKNDPSQEDAFQEEIKFMEKLKTVIKGSDSNDATLIIEGMDKFTPGNSKKSQQACIYELKDKYSGMNWEDPDIDEFINHQDASEIEFAVLLASEKGMNISSSESDMNQVIELCRRLEEPKSLEGFIPDQFELDLKECAFFIFAVAI